MLHVSGLRRLGSRVGPRGGRCLVLSQGLDAVHVMVRVIGHMDAGMRKLHLTAILSARSQLHYWLQYFAKFAVSSKPAEVVSTGTVGELLTLIA